MSAFYFWHWWLNGCYRIPSSTSPIGGRSTSRVSVVSVVWCLVDLYFILASESVVIGRWCFRPYCTGPVSTFIDIFTPLSGVGLSLFGSYIFVSGVDSLVKLNKYRSASSSWQFIDITDFAFVSGSVVLMPISVVRPAPSSWKIIRYFWFYPHAGRFCDQVDGESTRLRLVSVPFHSSSSLKFTKSVV